MLLKSKNKKNRRASASFSTCRVTDVEGLESRRMLSAATTATAHPLITFSPSATGSSIQGYTVSQIKHAYGFDQVSGNGSGQTIAIVDAYNDPNIWADLQVFDKAMGIADPPSFKQVSQSGGSTSGIATDAGWAGEIALDVEWAHAIAPKANIVLVEAKSASFNDLMAAVNFARNAVGVSVVSLSWGGSEFFGQTQFDSLFTTPAGHQGVTFVASAGDSGSWWGPQWPASSPNVLSVGGTTLYTSGGNGTHAGETGWSAGGGGVSWFESEPAYQGAAQGTGRRVAPDVSYNANPNTGFAVYDSVADGSYVGWQVVGGTSAGAPQWAALIALADQQRVAAGKGTLDGATGTLPTLYKLYNSPSTYTASFNDVSSGQTSRSIGAHAGYDAVSGLGTPKAAQVVAALSGNSTANAAATTTTTTAAATTTTTTTKTKKRRSASRSEVAVTATVADSVVPYTLPLSTSNSVTSVGYASRSASSLVANEPLLATPSRATSAVPAAATSVESPFSVRRIAVPTIAVTAPMIDPSAMIAIAATDTVNVAAAAPNLNGVFKLATTQTLAFADALASFADESASIGADVTAALGAPSRLRAWSATLAVIAIDAVVVASWLGNKRRGRRAPAPRELTFSLQPIR